MTARSFSIRFSMSYALLMMGSGVQLPFLPLWLVTKGIDVSGVAFIIAGMMAVRVVGAPLFAWAADLMGSRRLIIRLCAVGAFVAYAAMASLDGFWPIASAALLAGFLFAPVFPLSEGFSVDASAALGLDYGRMRLWASLSFLVGSLAAGALLTQIDAGNAAWILASAQGLAVIATLLLPDEPEALRKPKEPSPGGVLKLLFYSSFSLLLLVAGLAQASHGVLYTVSALHWRSLGFDTLMIGFLWTAAVSAEVALLAFSNVVVKRFGPEKLVLAGIAGGIVRWLGMAFATSFSANLVLQLLHVASFALTHLGTMHLIRQSVPEHARNRAQGIYSALAGGVLMASTSWMSGKLYGTLGGLAYLPMAALSIVALVGAMRLFGISPRVPRLART